MRASARLATMKSALTIRTLTDGGQTAEDVARDVAGFIAGASHTLDIAQYDFHLLPETAVMVCGAIREAAERGVRIRFLYNVDHRFPIPVPPPPEPDVQLIAELPVEGKAIAGVPDLMHHKYAIRDGEAVWTGSANWTDESWSRQENVIAVVESLDLAARFEANYEQLWTEEVIERTGFEEPDPVSVNGATVRPWFCPGHGEDLSRRYARAIGRARRRVRICSPVITATPVLAVLAQRASDGPLDIAGCVDLAQIRGVVHQWSVNGNIYWKLPLLQRALSRGFSGKASTPWEAEGSPHDFMHAKLTVADDTVFLGSFNLSHSGEQNAENVLEIEDAALADRMATFVEQVRARYAPLDLVQLAA
jgi:phosphatidylserine/phosphatidylglycerophosphate/cardiolipin synthase-like enzyme